MQKDEFRAKFLTIGWNIFKFIVTPDELIRVLKGFHHVVYTHRVSADYTESNPQDFHDRYLDFYQKLASGCYDFNGLYVDIGLSNDLAKCAFGEPFQDKRDKQFYKTQDFTEPCVGVSEFSLYITEKNKLETNILGHFTSGLQLQYPKKIYYPKSHDDHYTDSWDNYIEIPCDEIGTFEVYRIISDRIKSITKGLTFHIGDKKFRANVKISAEARKDFPNFYFAKHFGCV